MLASELIKDLRTLVEEYGDLEVVNDTDESVMVKFSAADEDGGDEDVFLVE